MSNNPTCFEPLSWTDRRRGPIGAPPAGERLPEITPSTEAALGIRRTPIAAKCERSLRAL